MLNVKIKICGITNLDDALCAIDNGTDALGFIFCKSKRQVKIQDVVKIVDKVPAFVSKVGVFMNSSFEQIEEAIKTLNLDVIQFHGQENEDFCLKFKNVNKVKSFSIKTLDDLKLIEKYPNINTILLDTKCPEGGGSGRVFDWSIAVQAKKYKKNIILAGGINPFNVSKAIKTVKPFAIDTSSGVEEYPRKKDYNKIKKLITEVRKTCLNF